MQVRTVWSWASASFGLLALMIQFQNCSPAGGAGSATEVVDGEVRVIDDWSSKPLSFPESIVQLHDESTDFVAQGLCPRKSEGRINWVLYDASKSVLSGSTICEMGGFQIDIANLDALKCGSEYDLQAYNAKGETTSMIVSRKCPPLMAQENFSNKASSETCYLELDNSPYFIEPVCFEACYVGNRLAFRETVARNRCGQQIGG